MKRGSFLAQYEKSYQAGVDSKKQQLPEGDKTSPEMKVREKEMVFKPESSSESD
jgi:hypothetical protein